jgi:hypothetical protein
MGDEGWAWSLFGPKNYDQCIEKGLENVKNDKQLNALTGQCYQEFKGGRTKYTGLFDDELRACGVTEPAYDYWLPPEHPHTKKIVSKLTEKSLKNNPFNAEFRFQNNNDIQIRKVRIALTKKGKNCQEYSRVFSFGGNRVAAGEYDLMVHSTVINFTGFAHFCVQTIQPPGISGTLLDGAKLYGFLKIHNYCGK